MIVKTEFDGLLEEDIVFEETEEVMKLEDTLKHSENIMKSFLYLRKMFSSTANMSRLVKVSTVEEFEHTKITPDAETNVIMFKNLSDQNFEINVNGGVLTLLPYESYDFPLTGIETLSFKGNGTIIETQYKLG